MTQREERLFDSLTELQAFLYGIEAYDKAKQLSDSIANFCNSGGGAMDFSDGSEEKAKRDSEEDRIEWEHEKHEKW